MSGLARAQGLLVAVALAGAVGAWAQAGPIVPQDGKTYPYVDGMQFKLGGDCWARLGAIEVYEDYGAPCYRQTYDFAGSQWAAGGSYYELPVPLTGDCTPILYDVPGPGTVVDGFLYKGSGIDYWSDSLACTYTRGRMVLSTSTQHIHAVVGDAADSCNGATVTYVEGDASYGGAPLGEGKKLAQPARLSTGANGKVEVEMSDGSILRLGPNSSVQLTCHDLDPGFTLPRLSLSLLLGKLWATLSPAGDRNISVETLNFVCGNRGTTFYLEVTPDLERFLVEDGAVEFIPKSGGSSLLLGACEAGQASGGALEKIPVFAVEDSACAVEAPPPAKKNGGCQAAGASGGWLACAALLAWLTPRARRRS